MSRISLILFGFFFFAAVGSAQDTAAGLLQRGIDAQGGSSNIAKLQNMRIKLEGTASLIPGQAAVPLILEDAWHMPDQYRSSSSFQIGGQKLSQTQVIIGDKGWIQMNGQTQDLPKEAVAEMKEQKYAEDLDHLGFLKDPGIELALVDPIEVDQKPASGVVVKRKGHRDVKLYFDKATGLLVKREHRLLDSASGKEVLQEIVFSDYQEKDGVKHYRKIKAIRDGVKVIDGTVVELEFFDKLNESLFARP
jgi:hypothetical protein